MYVINRFKIILRHIYLHLRKRWALYSVAPEKADTHISPIPSRFSSDDGSLKFATDSGIFIPELEVIIPKIRQRFRPTHVLDLKPMVFLCFGQSNAANSGEGLYVPQHPVFCFNIFDGEFYLAEDPLPGATGNGACPWGRMGDLLLAKNFGFKSLLFINIAVGGSFLLEWCPGGPHNRRLALAIERINRAGLSIHHMLWCQGEAEANHTNMLRHEYRAQFHLMMNDIRQQGITAPVHIALSTFCAAADNPFSNHLEIRSALAGLINFRLGMLPGPDTDVIGPEERFDGCHFNSIGLQHAAELWADAFVESIARRTPCSQTNPH